MMNTFVMTKHIFCHDKSMLAVQNFCHDKSMHVVQNFVATKYSCHDKHLFMLDWGGGGCMQNCV